MSVPTTITDLSVTAASNVPAGTDTVTTTTGPDEYFRALSAILRMPQAKGADVASATASGLGSNTDGDYFHVTGTTGIAASNFGTVSAGIEKTIVFDGALTLTHNATSFILPGGANITTTAGDVAVFRSEGSGNWKCTNYVRSAGYQTLDSTLTALAGTLTAANKIPYATALDTASELTFNPSTALAAGTTTVPSQTVVKTAVDDLVINCTTATPDLSADYFVFEDATDNTQKKALLNTISLFSTSYTSPTPSALSTGVIAENHGLGANPSLVQASFRCATAEAGYSIGDEIKVAGYDAPSVEAIATWANATQVGYTSSGTTIRVPNKSTGALTTLTLANWTVVLRAWK